MITDPAAVSTARLPELLGQTVVVIGGSAGIGFETARRARAEGADVIITGRDPARLERAASELGARSTAAFDAHDPERLERFFADLPDPIDHLLVTAGGPYYAPLAELDFTRALRSLDDEIVGKLRVARLAVGRVRPGGALLFMGGTGARHPSVGLTLAAAVGAAYPALVANLALELAPVRVNLIAAGFVDTQLSASILGDDLEARREQLRTTLPIRRVVGPADVAALAVHLMTNTALTGATYDVDGGEQLAVAAW
jgi:NAD(P)-dependent dehydrogenase (short-subunit alcohol dehydrogenase family)